MAQLRRRADRLGLAGEPVAAAGRRARAAAARLDQPRGALRAVLLHGAPGHRATPASTPNPSGIGSRPAMNRRGQQG
ncbi:hypothetical protein EJV46_07405 [Roseococcus sp. SYP-B2431]|nr:hypothetical protein EJV46_07405 [Roseococcus sp. SYP-B2431]